MAKVYLGLGSNLEDRHKNIDSALSLLKEEPALDLLRTSSVIETEAEGILEQPKFLNAVCEIETALFPTDLLAKLQRVETRLGRPKEHEKNSPRTIDIDILVFGDLLLKGKTLTIPHPRLNTRFFALNGLNELAPDLLVPGHKKTISQLLAELQEINEGNQQHQADATPDATTQETE